MTLVPAIHTPCAVPSDFDQHAYYRVATAAAAFHDRASWSSYASGFNGLVFRFVAADAGHERFAAAISRSDAFHPSGPRYVQEEALFSFFINSLSTLECLYFALYNLVACIRPGAFPAKTSDDLRAVNIEETAKRFKNAYGGKPLAKLLMNVRRSKELGALRIHRDFLTHRGASPRRHELGRVAYGAVIDMGSAKSVTIPSNPKEVPANWTSDLSLTPDMTGEPRAWLGKTTNDLLRETDLFLQSVSATAQQ